MRMSARSNLVALAMTLIAGTATAHQIADIKMSIAAPAFMAALSSDRRRS